MESKIDETERLLSGWTRRRSRRRSRSGSPSPCTGKKPFRPQGLASLYDENRSVLSFEETSQTLYEGRCRICTAAAAAAAGVGGGGEFHDRRRRRRTSLGSNRVGDSVVSGGGGGGSGSGGKQRCPRTALGLSSPERADASATAPLPAAPSRSTSTSTSRRRQWVAVPSRHAAAPARRKSRRWAAPVASARR